jgi:hypothetical protein
MQVVCCVCNKKIKEKEPIEDKRVSHGYCSSCAKKELNKIRKDKSEQ